MTPFEIRPPRAGEAAGAGAIVVAAGVAAWAQFLTRERIEAAVRGRDQPVDLVAVDRGGEVVGFVAWDAGTGEITRLYTHPAVWGKGAGRALLDAALEALRAGGCRQAWLNTEERNERPRRFYERHGWRVEGEARVRDWHGAQLCEPRYVRDL